MGKNVMLPMPLFERIIDLLGHWDVSKYDAAIQSERSDVLYRLNQKMDRLALRDEYAKIIRANCQDDRDAARINYLQQKCWLDGCNAGSP